MLTEHQRMEETEPTEILSLGAIGCLTSRTVVKYRNNDFDNFKSKSTKALMGKVPILRPRLQHNKSKYLKTLKNIRHF